MIHLKNNSTCHLDLYRRAIEMAGRLKLLVRNENRFFVSGSTNLILLRTSGYSFAELNPARTTTWSQRRPVVRSTERELRLFSWELRLARVTKKAEV